MKHTHRHNHLMLRLPVRMDSNASYIYDADGQMLFEIRGWGHLTGVGGLNLPANEAETIQRGRGQALVDALNAFLATP